ncbi:Metalloprotease MmpA [Dirofilaria immitis]
MSAHLELPKTDRDNSDETIVFSTSTSLMQLLTIISVLTFLIRRVQFGPKKTSDNNGTVLADTQCIAVSFDIN